MFFEFSDWVEIQEFDTHLEFWFARGTQLQVFFFKIFLFKISLLKCDNWTIFNPTSLKGAITWYYFKFYVIKIFHTINARTRFQFLLKASYYYSTYQRELITFHPPKFLIFLPSEGEQDFSFFLKYALLFYSKEINNSFYNKTLFPVFLYFEFYVIKYFNYTTRRS